MDKNPLSNGTDILVDVPTVETLQVCGNQLLRKPTLFVAHDDRTRVDWATLS